MSEAKSAPSTRDSIRSALLGVEAPFRKLEREINGVKVELRQPTVSARSEILRRANVTEIPRKGQPPPRMDVARLHVEAILACVYVPGTNDHVFGPADREKLQAMPAGGWVDEIGEACLELANVEKKKDEEEDGEGSDPNP